MPYEMRLLLQTSRAVYNQSFLDAGKAPKKSTRLSKRPSIWELLQGRDTLSPSMAVAAQYDPVAAILLQSSPRDVVMTIVDGIVRKEQGNLSTVLVTEEEEKRIRKKENLEWADVVKELVVRREVLTVRFFSAEYRHVTG
jgi:hypothetical protein